VKIAKVPNVNVLLRNNTDVIFAFFNMHDNAGPSLTVHRTTVFSYYNNGTLCITETTKFVFKVQETKK